ncbi:MAG TPA: hypothetical protein VKU44_05870 [Terriglobia bacterium]|nr:hypothetical protein [Terriglobia bacterium]
MILKLAVVSQAELAEWLRERQRRGGQVEKISVPAHPSAAVAIEYFEPARSPRPRL